MKTVIDKQLLLDKLTVAGRFCSNKLSSIVSLQGVSLETVNDKLIIYSTNLNQYYHTTATVKNDGDTRIVIEGVRVCEFLSLMPEGPVTLESDGKKLIVSGETVKGTFPVMVAGDFPPLPKLKLTGDASPATIMNHINYVLFSAARDESRPVLAAVNFLEKDGELLMVSTDGFRLSLVRSKMKESYPNMLIPASFLSDVIRSVKDKKNMKLIVSESEKIAAIKTGEDMYYTRLIDGEFPPFEKVVPSEHVTQVTIDREELLRNAKLISILARDHSNIIILDVVKDGFHIRPKTESGEEGGAFLEAEVKGEPIQVAFNFKFILEYLNTVSSAKSVTIDLLRPDAPVVFRASGLVDLIHIIMPVRIQS